MWVHLKWVKSNERKERDKKKKEKSSVNNGQVNAWTKYQKVESIIFAVAYGCFYATATVVTHVRH